MLKIQMRCILHKKEFAPWKLLVYSPSLVSSQGETLLGFQIWNVKCENSKR